MDNQHLHANRMQSNLKVHLHFQQKIFRKKRTIRLLKWQYGEFVYALLLLKNVKCVSFNMPLRANGRNRRSFFWTFAQNIRHYRLEILERVMWSKIRTNSKDIFHTSEVWLHEQMVVVEQWESKVLSHSESNYFLYLYIKQK